MQDRKSRDEAGELDKGPKLYRLCFKGNDKTKTKVE